MNKYSITFKHDGKTWEFPIYADSFEEAEKKLESLKENAEVSGEVVCENICQ